jgi:hypothetical protein
MSDEVVIESGDNDSSADESVNDPQPANEPVVGSAKARSHKRTATRRSVTVFGLGSGITEVDSNITGSRLPTSVQVLLCMLYHLKHGAHENCTKWDAAKIVLSKIAVFFAKANIPVIADRKACEKIIKLHDDNDKIRAIPIKRRSTPGTLKKLQEMERKLSETFPLWPANVEQLIKNPEDLRFLQSMKSDRAATFGGHDKVLDGIVRRRQSREMSLAAHRKRAAHENVMTSSAACVSEEHDLNNSSSSDESESCAAGPSNVTPRSHHRINRTGTSAFVPYDIIKRPRLVALATRLKMTPAQQAVYTEAVISEAGGDLSKVAASYSTADKSRRRVARELSETYRKEWVAPTLATLHWDSKLMSSLSNRNVTEERLTVVIGTALEMKLLGVPAYKPGTDRRSGEIIADLTFDMLSS